MDSFTLNISTSGNRALNADGVTQLRGINLVQGDSYLVNLAFDTTPAIAALSFDLRNSAGANLVAITGFATGAPYPYNFTLPLTSPALIANGSYQNLKAFLSYTVSGGGIEVIAPFNVRIANVSSGVSGGYVSSFNSLMGNVLLSGAGNVSITGNGQTVIVSGNVSALATQAALNASGNALAGQVSSLSGAMNSSAATLQSSLNATGSALAASISALSGQTGTFYPASNPSGFITSSSLSLLQAATGTLGGQVSTLQNATGTLGGEISTLQTATGTLGGQIATLQGATGTLEGQIGALQSATGALQTEIASIQQVSGNYYPASNPSGFITSAALAPYALESALTGASGILQSEIAALQGNTGNYALISSVSGLSGALQSEITSLQTATSGYYPNSNPSGFITSAASQAALTGASGVLQGEINANGALITSLQNATGNYYLNSNPSGFITASTLSPYALQTALSGASGLLQNQISTLQGFTGSYATIAYVTGISGFLQNEIGNYALSSYVTGISGLFQSEISTLQSQTGNYASIAYVTGISGALHSQILGIGGGSGGSVSNVVYLTGAQTISGTKSFASNPVFNGINDPASPSFTVIDIGNYQLRRNPGDGYVTIIDWSNETLNNSLGNPTIDWQNQILSGNWTTIDPVSSSQIATKAYVDANAGGGGSPRVTGAVKMADETRALPTNTIPVRDSDLQFQIKSGEIWNGEFFIRAWDINGVSTIQLQFPAQSSTSEETDPVNIFALQVHVDSASASAYGDLQGIGNIFLPAIQFNLPTSSAFLARFEFSIQATGDGTFGIGWFCQAGVLATVAAGSYMNAWRIA